MLKKTRLVVSPLLACMIFLLLPAISFAAPNHPTQPFTTPALATFTGLVTHGNNKGALITGGLSLDVGGAFVGTFNETNGAKSSVQGQFDQQNNITFTFSHGSETYLTAQGTLFAPGKFTGVFQLLDNGRQVASGIWSWQFVGPGGAPVVGLAFGGVTTSGPDKGTKYYGAIALNDQTWTGSFHTPNGRFTDASAQIMKSGNIIITFHFPSGDVIARGKPIVNGIETGYDGSLSGPKPKDHGEWRAYFFSFSF